MCEICPHCNSGPNKSGSRNPVVRKGHYLRSSDSVRVARFYCKNCGRNFSEASSDVNYGQKKRTLNTPIWAMLVSGVSQRRIALVLNTRRRTVVRKFLLLSGLARDQLESRNLQYSRAVLVQFDDLETSVHTKLKPVSVTLAVEEPSRRILGFEVSQMPAKGKIARISIAKYGKQPDERSLARARLFSRIKPLVADGASIRSDMNPHYPADVKKHFPKSMHETHKGRRGCVVGQGELKKIGYDPLFSLNHTCAMLRANINRLFRRTWCTTKKIKCLEHHIYLYAYFHNEVLLPKQLRQKPRNNLLQPVARIN